MRISFPGKPRKDTSGLWTDKSGSTVFVGADYALQNEIDQSLAERNARSCFKGCLTCGACANSKRDNFNMQYLTDESGITIAKSPTKSYDYVEKKWVDCRSCEPFRFHDCHNGVMRNSRQEAEPFTPDQIDLIESSLTGKPLIG